jgi:hypothetical protein
MSLHPFKSRLPTTLLSIPYHGESFLDQISVLNRLLAASRPSASFPRVKPLSHAFDRVVRVGVHYHVGVHRYHVQCALEGEKFGALVCLAGAGEAFVEVSVSYFSQIFPFSILKRLEGNEPWILSSKPHTKSRSRMSLPIRPTCAIRPYFYRFALLGRRHGRDLQRVQLRCRL